MSISHLRNLLTGRPLEDAVLVGFLIAFLFELLRMRSTSRADPERRERAKLPPSVAFLPLLVLVNALDIKGFFLNSHGFSKYAISGLFLAIFFLGPRRSGGIKGIARSSAVVFVLYSLIGTILGVIYVHPLSSGLAVGVSSVFLLIPLVGGKLDEEQCERLLSMLMVLCLLELVVNFLASGEYINSGINRTVGPIAQYSNGTFTHEKVAIVFMAFHLVRKRGGFYLKIATTAMMLVIFANYPAGTYVLAALAYVLVLVVVKRRGRIAVAVVGGVALLCFFAVTIVTGGGGSLEQKYYTAVGKSDNTSSRSILWEASLKAIDQHPWVGSSFTGEGSVHVQTANLPPDVPPHNDYLELALLGGWLSVVLFGAAVFGYLRELDHGVLRSRQGSRGLLARTLAIGIALSLVTMVFNPSLLKVSLSSLMFCLVGVVACVGVRVEDDAPELQPTTSDRLTA